jgi:hypothetical protein
VSQDVNQIDPVLVGGLGIVTYEIQQLVQPVGSAAPLLIT